jgi:GABA(A) receptor-associated protein
MPIQTDINTLLKKYPGFVPVYIKLNTDLPLKKCKYLVPHDVTVAQFMYTIRKKLDLSPEKAVFMHVDNVLCSSSSPMSTLYQKYNNNGLLEICLTVENTFGNM